MNSRSLEKILEEAYKEQVVTIPGLMSSFELNADIANHVYERIKRDSRFHEKFFIECPCCGSDVTDGDSEDADNYLGKSLSCDHCDTTFEVTSQEVLKYLQQVTPKKKAS